MKIRVYAVQPGNAHASLSDAPDTNPQLISEHAPTFKGLRNAAASAMDVRIAYKRSHGGGAAQRVWVQVGEARMDVGDAIIFSGLKQDPADRDQGPVSEQDIRDWLYAIER